ncbi:hypothetical protein NP493_786g01017 [Ridgeia piscesae]|uniref:Protein quiver n=1 Tax=Ridgeia piscesae TaxID=27915 RepID=A0AAD9KN80_RIDPI|nr:hypothetical protein NP493_786g01017 [Ridgeia piscesae]
MKRLAASIGVTVALFILIEYVSSQSATPVKGKILKCYQCNSFYDKGCADYFDNMTYPLIPCSEKATMCRKIIQEAFYDGRWDIRYIRQCAEKGEVGPDSGRWCKERLGTYGVRVKTCHCDDKDGCNGAASWTLNHTLVMALTLYILMYLGSRLRCL